MANLFICTYDVTDPERYAEYNPGSMGIILSTLAKHGGEVVVAEKGSEYMTGDSRHVTIVLRFPTADAAKAWHDDPEYVPARDIRLSATENITAIIAEEFVPPSA